MKKHHAIVLVVGTWLLVSFVPQLSAANLLGHAGMTGAKR
jgi:hypothetical protein